MRIYWLKFEPHEATVIVENEEGTIRECKVFEIVPKDTSHYENQQSLKSAWRYLEKIATNYARRNSMKAYYTAHPDYACAAWIVE